MFEKTNSSFILIQTNNQELFWTLSHEVPGAGNSFDIQFYSIIDEEPFPGINYYKLIQFDYDGISTESKVFSIQFNSQTLN